MFPIHALVLLSQFAIAGGPKPRVIPHLKCAYKFFAADDAAQTIISELDPVIDEMIKTYSTKLGRNRDPFAIVFRTEEADRIFKGLLYRKKDGVPLPSHLGLVVDAIRKSYVDHLPFDEKFVRETLELISKDLTGTERLALSDEQGNLLALKYAKEYLNRFRIHEAVDLNGNPLDEEKKKEQKEEKKKKKDKGPPPPFEYPDLPDVYTPSISDTEGEGGESQAPAVVAESNAITPYFKSGHFTRLLRPSQDGLQQADIPGAPTAVGGFEHTTKNVLLRFGGRKNVIAYLPPGFKPLQPADTRVKISKDLKGRYRVETSVDLESVEIPIIPDDQITLSAIELDFYTRPVGFKKDEWPENVQALFRKFNPESVKQNPLVFAKALNHLIATDYLYSVGERPELDPIDAMKGGAFQCSHASYIMAAILRDIYQIPTRVGRGFRAKLHKGGRDNKSYLVIPGAGHVWIEVYYDGKWHTFDPTPVKKDKKKKEDGEPSEYTDVPTPDLPDPEPEEGEPSDSSQPAEPGDKDSKSHKEKIDKNTEDRKKSVDQSKDKKESKEATKEAMDVNELLKNLELGSLELKNKTNPNPIWERLMRTLTRIIVEPNRTGNETAVFLNQAADIYKTFGSDQLTALFQEATAIHSAKHPRLKEWAEEIFYQLKTVKLPTTYQKLYTLERSLVLYGRLLDQSGPIPNPTELLTKIRQVRNKLKTLAYAKSGDITLVQNSTDNLPAVARTMLKLDHEFSSAGINPPTAKLAAEINAGKQNDLRLLNILSPLADFVLNTSPRPESRDVKLLERDPKRPQGTDLMPAVRFSELTRAFLTQANKTPLQNFRDRTAYVRTRRKVTQIPTTSGNQTAERITIVLYDTSGSMHGDPARFQAGLISAFTAKALSDVDPWGRHRHRVLIIPFDDSPKSSTRVTTVDAALDVIRNYQSKLANTKGGTNIQAALMEAYAQIADAERRKGEPLAAANIVLMTDGQATINAEELMKARNAIDRKTPIQLFFAAIGTTNEELVKFANSSESIGAKNGFYLEYSNETMTDILKDADTIRVENKESDFYTDKTVQDLPPDVEDLLSEVLDLAIKYQSAVTAGNRYRTPYDHLEDLARIDWLGVEHKDRDLETWLIRVRSILQTPVFKNKNIIERIADDIVTHFETIARTPLNDLANHEQEHLRHIVRQAMATK